jgi:hypothetical protein
MPGFVLVDWAMPGFVLVDPYCSTSLVRVPVRGMRLSAVEGSRTLVFPLLVL